MPPSKRRRGARVVLAALAALVAALAVLVFVSPLGGIVWVQFEERSISSHANMERMVRSLAVYCDSLGPEDRVEGIGWTPPELSSMRPRESFYGGVSRDGAWLEFGGGFHHFGLSMQRTPGGAPGDWTVESYSEDEWVAERTRTFSVQPKPLPREEALRRLSANYAWHAQAEPENAESLLRLRENFETRFLAPSPAP